MNAIAPITTVDLVLRMARSYLWVREIGGANQGEVVKHILDMVGLKEGQPWCAAFVAMIGHDSLGLDWPLPMVGGCATLGEAAAKKEMLYAAPAPGAVFLLYSAKHGRFNHTGFVDQPSKNGWHTIEGNTSPDGSPEGTGVFGRERDFTNPHDRFIYWWKPLE